MCVCVCVCVFGQQYHMYVLLTFLNHFLDRITTAVLTLFDEINRCRNDHYYIIIIIMKTIVH